MNDTEPHVWRPLNRPDFGVVDSISDVIYQEEWRTGGFLTSVRQAHTIFLASDYGGSHKKSAFETQSFLVADLQFTRLWDEFRKRLRKETLLDGRRISYKNLNDRQRRKAIVPFLRFSNTITGLLANFILDQGAIELLSELPLDNKVSATGPLSRWNPESFKKLSRVGKLGAMLISCLAGYGQNVIWISDEDEIAPNKEKLFDATKVLGHYLNHFCKNQMGHFRFGTTEIDTNDLQLEDLVAVADLAAGALSEILTANLKNTGVSASRIQQLITKSVSLKAKVIANWLSENIHPLKKLIVLVETSGKKYTTKFINLYAKGKTGQFDWHPEVDEYFSDKIITSV